MPEGQDSRADDAVACMTVIDIAPKEADAVRRIAVALHPATKAKLEGWGELAMRYIEVQPSSPLRKHGFVEPMGGGMARLTERGEIARLALVAAA